MLEVFTSSHDFDAVLTNLNSNRDFLSVAAYHSPDDT